MIDKKNDGGRGFEKMGRPNVVIQKPKNVVSFDVDRANQAIERAAKQLELERAARTRKSEEQGIPLAPTPEEIDPTVAEIKEKTSECNMQVALWMLGRPPVQELSLGNCIRSFAYMDDAFIEENQEYVMAVVLHYEHLNDIRKRGLPTDSI